MGQSPVRATLEPLFGRFITFDQVAARLGVAKRTVSNHAAKGRPPVGAFRWADDGKLWRVRSWEFEAWCHGWWDPEVESFLVFAERHELVGTPPTYEPDPATELEDET